jgi:hypothetical protein
MPRTKKADRKIFVLDTSVILYDHNAINQFQEHDVAIPITVLEELDNFKKVTNPSILPPGNSSGSSTSYPVNIPLRTGSH